MMKPTDFGFARNDECKRGWLVATCLATGLVAPVAVAAEAPLAPTTPLTVQESVSDDQQTESRADGEIVVTGSRTAAAGAMARLATQASPPSRSVPLLRRSVRVASLALAAWGITALIPATTAAAANRPMSIERQGSFAAGGTTIGDPDKASLACDHGFVEFQIPTNARRTALLLWHSSSVAVWQQRWDGGEGFQSIFLRRRFPVYLWDGPRVGRANWGCEAYPHNPDFGRDQLNFNAWRFGTAYPNWFPGVQFPTQNKEAWKQALRARYDEFDTIENARLQAAAAAAAVDRIGPTVLVTNSAGGLRALLTAIRSDKVRAIVAYENPGYLFPEGEGPSGPPGRFGPYTIPLDDFKKLARIPIQFVWGDNIDKTKIWPAALEQSRQFAALINKYGGKAEVVRLTDKGLRGNTHIPFADLNNVAVAEQLSLFLKRHKLDR